MGITNGASTLRTRFQRGLYQARPKRYNIYVDGELMRYKGMVQDNLTKHDAEEAIAATSYDYLVRLKQTIESHLHQRAESVHVYLDGARVRNKITNRPDFKFDASLVRNVFAMYCEQNDMHVKHLDYGESELQMYLQRDREMDLNVFVTNDSDMLSICYGHRATAIENWEEDCDKTEERDTSSDNIVDLNRTYARDVVVRDSCLWVSCAKMPIAYGFDECSRSLCFGTVAFRTFVALCGTDFTPPMLTDSLIEGVLNCDCNEIKRISLLDNTTELAAALLMLGIRGGGRIKRDEHSVDVSFDRAGFEKMVQMYIEYVSSGSMSSVDIPRPQMSLVTRHLLYALKDRDDCFSLKPLREWSNRVTLDEALENLRKCIGSYEEIAAKKARPSLKHKSRKRAANPNSVSELCRLARFARAKVEHDMAQQRDSL